MSFVAVAFAEEGKTPLVEVYCSFISSEKNIANTDGVTMGTFDERWANFITYLENREVFLKVNESSEEIKDFAQCLSSNKEKFEVGEFALSGLRSVEVTKDLMAKAEVSLPDAPELIASNLNLLDREISTPDMEVVYGFIPEKRAEEIPKTLLEGAVDSRQEQYASLWKGFTEKLKDSYMMQQSGLSVLTKEVK